MHLRLALVVSAGQTDCVVRWLGEQSLVTVQYSSAIQNQIKIRPRQLVAVQTTTNPPVLVWRWFRGRVEYQQEGYVVVNHRLYQASAHRPINVLQLPERLRHMVQVGDELFYSLDNDGVVIDRVADEHPAHPAQIQADLFPAIEAFYQQLR